MCDRRGVLAATAHEARRPGPALDLDPFATTPEQLAASSTVVVDATGAVYWGTPNGLRRHEAGVGAGAANDAGITSLASLGAPVSGLQIEGGRLHYAVNGSPLNPDPPSRGHLGSCALPGCSDVVLFPGTPYPFDLVVLGASRWWMGTDTTGQNLALQTVGTTLSGTQNMPSRMVTDGQRIYWSTVDGLRMFVIAAGMLVDLLPAATTAVDRVNGIALGPIGTLYVTQAGRVSRCTLAADKCAFTPLATTSGTTTEVAVDGTAVYWGTSDGSVWRLLAP